MDLHFPNLSWKGAPLVPRGWFCRVPGHPEPTRGPMSCSPQRGACTLGLRGGPSWAPGGPGADDVATGERWFVASSHALTASLGRSVSFSVIHLLRK